MCRKFNRFVASSVAIVGFAMTLVGCDDPVAMATGGALSSGFGGYYDPNSAGGYGGYYDGGGYSGGSASSGGNWYNYGWNEYDGSGNSSSFSLNPGTNVHESLDNYLSSNISYP